MLKRTRRTREPVTSKQAQSTIDRYHQIIDAKPFDRAKYSQLSPEDRRDTDAVASALILIRQLLDDYTSKMTPTPERYAESGLTQAYDLVDTLTTGYDWQAFWRHITSLGRMQNAPPTNYENLRRSSMAGFARALQQVSNGELSETRAIEMAIELCPFPGVTFTVDQIRKWGTQSKDQDGEAPNNNAALILGEATKYAGKHDLPLSACVIHCGRVWVRQWWSVPNFEAREGLKDPKRAG
jgi:hypothetical protein